MHCPHCGQEHQESTVFCPTTGQKLPVFRYCMNCGLKLQSTWKVCPKCGARVSETEKIRHGESKHIINSPKSWKPSRILLIGSFSVLILFFTAYLIYPHFEIFKNTTSTDAFTVTSSTETGKLTVQDEYSGSTPPTESSTNNDIADNRWKVAFLREDGTLLLSDNSGDTVTEIKTGIPIADIWEMSWSPNGQYLLIQIGFPARARYLVDIYKKKTYAWPQSLTESYQFQWSPDSRKLAITTLNDSGQDWKLYIVSIYGDIINTVDGLSFDEIPSWSPNSQDLAAPASPSGSGPHRLYLITADTGDFKDITPTGFDLIRSTSWLQDGRLIFEANNQGYRTWHILDLTTGDTDLLYSNSPTNGYVRYPKISTSGAMFAYVAEEIDGTWSIYVENLKTKEREQIWHVDAAYDVGLGAWSPGDSYLIFTKATDTNRLNNQTYLIKLYNKQIQPLPGGIAWIQNNSNWFSSNLGWINENQLLISKPIDENNSEVVIVDVLGNELQSLCSLETVNKRCALWTSP